MIMRIWLTQWKTSRRYDNKSIRICTGNNGENLTIKYPSIVVTSLLHQLLGSIRQRILPVRKHSISCYSLSQGRNISEEKKRSEHTATIRSSSESPTSSWGVPTIFIAAVTNSSPAGGQFCGRIKLFRKYVSSKGAQGQTTFCAHPRCSFQSCLRRVEANAEDMY